MTLENLLKIGQLKEHATDAGEIRRLLAAARRNLADARVRTISVETRFDAAYRAIMQISLVALMANGFRPATNRPGHHMTMLQVLPRTMGLPNERMVVLDALRRKRNLSDYTGDDIDETSMESCVQEAECLLESAMSWLTKNRPDLIEE